MTPDPLVDLGSIGGSTGPLAATGNTVLIGEGTNLLVVDTSDPHPGLMARMELPGDPDAIHVEGSLAFVLVDAYADGEAPARTATYQLGPVYDLAVADGLAYLAVAGLGLDAVNLADPAEPSRQGMLRALGDVTSVQADGGLALVTDDRSLWILDMRRPEQPEIVLRLDKSGPEDYMRWP